MVIYQGDTLQIPIRLKRSGVAITDVDVKKVEFAIGEIVKTYPEQASYSNGCFLFTLSQEETFSLSSMGKTQFQVRIYFTDGSVKNAGNREAIIVPSISKVVLK